MRGEAEQSPRADDVRLAKVFSLLAGVAAVLAAVYLPSTPASEPSPPSAGPAVRPPDDVRGTARRQAGLVIEEDDRLRAHLRNIPFGSGPYVDRDHGAPTAVLTARTDQYDLGSLLSMGAAARVDEHTVDLTTSVLIAPGAHLVLDAPGTTLRLRSSASGFTSLVGWKGSLTLVGRPGSPLAVTSWDPDASAVDREVGNGRAYIRITGSTLKTSFTVLSGLGFWSGRTGGVALTGGDSGPATGSIADTTIRGNHYGLFSSDTQRLQITDSIIEDSAADGVLLHRGSVGAAIRSSVVRSSAGRGVVAGGGSSSVEVRDVAVEDNGGHGIVLDGRPLADNPGPSGASLDGQSGFRVENCTARSNRGSGILAWDVAEAVVAGNGLTGNAEGVVVRGTSRRVQVQDNEITSSARVGIAVRDGAADVTVQRNDISGASTGIQVRGSRADVRDNQVESATAHGLSFQRAADGSSALRNTLGGSGPSGLDLARLDTGATVEVSGNSEEHWEVRLSLGRRLRGFLGDHPLLLLWTLLLTIPVVATLLDRPRRYRRWQKGPYAMQKSVAVALDFTAAADAASGSSTRVSLARAR
jgi:parallel beta-helix repeat protein